MYDCSHRKMYLILSYCFGFELFLVNITGRRNLMFKEPIRNGYLEVLSTNGQHYEVTIKVLSIK